MDPHEGTPGTTLTYLLSHFVCAGLASVGITLHGVSRTIYEARSDNWSPWGLHWSFEAFKSNNGLLLWVFMFKLYLYSEMMEYLFWLYIKFFLGQITEFTQDVYKPMRIKVGLLIMSGIYYSR